MDVAAANKVAAVIIASFDKRSNRPLLLSLAIFVAENPGCKTVDVASHFCPERMHRSVKDYESERGAMHHRLDSLVKAGVLVKDYETVFVPKQSRKSTRPGLGCIVKNNTAIWSLRQEFNAT